MSRHLFVVGRTDRLGASFVNAARSSAAFTSVRAVESVSDLDAVDNAVVLVCDGPAGPLMSLAERLPVVVCGSDSPGHPLIHWVPCTDDADALVRSFVSLVDQVWSARQAQHTLREEAERANRFFAVLANASMEAVIVFREGHVVHVNDLACRILGFDRDDLIGIRTIGNVAEEWREQVQSRMAGDDSVYSFLFRRPDGSTVPIRVHGQSIDVEGVDYRITSFTDLSREFPVPYADDWSERELYGAEAPVVWVGGNGDILYMNSVMRTMLLIGDDEVESMKIWDVDEELNETSWPAMMDDFRTRGAMEFRSHIRRMDDSTFPIQVHGRYRRLDDFEYVSASFEDVTSQVEMRRSIVHSRQRLGLALEAATLGLWEWNVDRDVVSLSPEMEEMLTGFDGLPTSGHRALVTGVDRRDVPAMITTIQRAVESSSRFSVRCRLSRGRGDDQPRWMECWGDVLEDEDTGETIVLGAAMDITERRRRLQEIQRERERFRAFADGSLDGFLLLEARLTADGVLDFVAAYANAVMYDITGADPMSMLDQSMRDRCPVSVDFGIGDLITRAYTSGETREGELEVKRSSGAITWLRVQAVPYSEGVGVIVRDITDRRRQDAELTAYRQKLEKMVEARTARLKRSEAEFRSVVQTARDIMGIVDENHIYQFVNEAARFSRNDTIIGKRAGMYIRESHRQTFHDAIDEVFDTGGERRLEFPVDWDDGSVKWMDCRFAPVASDKNVVESVTIICRDVTDQHQINRELEQRVLERTTEIGALLDTSRKLAALQEEPKILGTVTDTLSLLVPGAIGVSVWARETDDPEIGLLARDGALSAGGDTDRIPADDEILDRIRETDSAILLTQDEADQAALDRLLRVNGCPAALATTVADARGMELFVLVALDETGAPVDERTIRLLESVTTQAAVAIHNARLFREIRSISVRLLHVQENERREIAHELHDQVGGLLTSLQFVLQLSATSPEDDANETAGEALAMVRSLMEDVRSLTLTLRPALLDDFGLAPAVEGLIQRHRKQGALDVDFDYDFERGMRFNADVETTAYRVIQEALTNVIRHAETDVASVLLSLTEEELLVEIEDRGLGFLVDRAVERGRSLGVRGMFERVKLMEGHMNIDTVPGEGTRIRFRIPLIPQGRSAS